MVVELCRPIVELHRDGVQGDLKLSYSRVSTCVEVSLHVVLQRIKVDIEEVRN